MWGTGTESLTPEDEMKRKPPLLPYIFLSPFHPFFSLFPTAPHTFCSIILLSLFPSSFQSSLYPSLSFSIFSSFLFFFFPSNSFTLTLQCVADRLNAMELCYSPYQPNLSPSISIASPKSASFTTAPFSLLANKRFSGCEDKYLSFAKEAGEGALKSSTRVVKCD